MLFISFPVPPGEEVPGAMYSSLHRRVLLDQLALWVDSSQRQQVQGNPLEVRELAVAQALLSKLVGG